MVGTARCRKPAPGHPGNTAQAAYALAPRLWLPFAVDAHEQRLASGIARPGPTLAYMMRLADLLARGRAGEDAAVGSPESPMARLEQSDRWALKHL
jgi:hypothetical protein